MTEDKNMTLKMACTVLACSIGIIGFACSENETTGDTGTTGNTGATGDAGTSGDAGANTDNDSNNNSDNETDSSNSTDTQNNTQSSELSGTIRDFKDDHIDFENAGSPQEDGIVATELGQYGKPVYAGGGGTATTHGADPFNQWYRNVDGVNQNAKFTIKLTPGPDGVYTYNNQEFFPIDDQLFGNQGRNHNYHFTYEIHTVFTYKGGEVFSFTGDDDLWVFINGRLAIDIGGVHGPLSETADLDAMKDQLGIEEGNSYPLDFFFAERHVVMSTFRIDTTISDLTPVEVY